ncbi:hypothetical protein PP707_07565 [Acetobacter pasteurianus]|nr:hypothetical protein [Acetobacter pasteurianus]
MEISVTDHVIDKFGTPKIHTGRYAGLIKITVSSSFNCYIKHYSTHSSRT